MAAVLWPASIAAPQVKSSFESLQAHVFAKLRYCTPSNDAADVACLRVAESSARHFQAAAPLDIHDFGPSSYVERREILASNACRFSP